MFYVFRFRLQKLPDKGKKIQDLYDRTLKALKLKNEIDTAANLLSSLNLGFNDLSNLEWEGKITAKKPENILDSDDDEDPLAILTSSNSATHNKVIVKHSKENEAENTLITANDIKEAQEISKGHLHLDPVLEQVCQHDNQEPPHRFLFYKPKSNSLNASHTSQGHEDKKKLRENSAASPPVTTHGVIPLSIRESVEIEHLQRLKMKQLHENQATERLAVRKIELEKNGIVYEPNVSKKPETTSMSKYRIAPQEIEDFEEEENENDSLSEEENDE